jgi:asparagine synthase (glutamine-hydrolysing)
MSVIYDEPFADSSQLPTLLVMQLARQHVSVALTGDGGDEIFAGYNRYSVAPRVWGMVGWLPHSVRKTLGRLLLTLRPEQWDLIARPVSSALRQANVGGKVHKLGQRLKDVRTFDDLYLALVSEWPAGSLASGRNGRGLSLLELSKGWPEMPTNVERMMAIDALTYMADDILVKVDRAAMANSLETRAPFLDHRVAELAWRLPLSQKMRDGTGKWLLRQVLYKHVPKELIDRPKMGFSVPLDAWLRGPLREWAESLLSEERIRRDGYFDPVPIRHAWDAHVKGGASFGHRLWSVLMFQAWASEQKIPG